MKNTIAGGVVALSLMASATSMANEAELLDLQNLEILTSGQVQLDGAEIESNIIAEDEIIIAANVGCITNIGMCGKGNVLEA